MNRLLVLIADDEPDLLETLELRLRLEDRYEVLTARNGLEALGMARVNEPHLVLLDVMMPGENGYRVAHLLREDEASGAYGRELKIVLLTARDLSDDPERERMFREFSRADEVIYKPFDLERLVGLIESLLPAETVIN